VGERVFASRKSAIEGGTPEAGAQSVREGNKKTDRPREKRPKRNAVYRTVCEREGNRKASKRPGFRNQTILSRVGGEARWVGQKVEPLARRKKFV